MTNFNAFEILDALAKAGTITVLPSGDITEEQVLDLAGFTPAERHAYRVARDTPDAQCTPDQSALLLRYEDARNTLMYGEEI